MITKLECEQCGTSFNCGSDEDRMCWCMQLPNMAGRPDCLTLGKAKQITRQRKARKMAREQQKELLR